MKITVPERVAGAKDALLVLEIELPVETTERTISVDTEGALQALDLQGSGPGGTYTVPVGLERLHVPMRVTEDGAGEARIQVAITEGPEAGTTEERTLVLESGAAVASSGGSGAKLALVGLLVIALVAAGIWLVPKLLGGPKVPNVVGKREDAARTMLEEAGYDVSVRTDETDNAEWHGLVTRTIPAGGERKAKGQTVEIVLGSYRDQNRLVPVPNIVGAAQADAVAALDAVGFQPMVRFIDPPNPESIGRVVRQSPDAGRHVPLSAAVELFVGRDKPSVPEESPPEELPPTEVPDLPVVPEETPPEETPPPEEMPPEEMPPEETPPEEMPPEEAPPEETGEPKMPDLMGCTESHAQDQLDLLDLYAIVEMAGAADMSQVGRVIKQAPPAGSTLRPGDPITITVGIRTGTTAPSGTPPEEAPPEEMPPEEVPPEEAPPEEVPPEEMPPEEIPPEEVPPEEVPPEELPPEEVPPEETPPEEVPPEEMPPEEVPPEEVPPEEAPPEEPSKPRVPDLIGLSRIRAETLVRDTGFRPRILLEVTPDVPDGQVLSQEPGPGDELKLGGTVRVIVARRPPAQGVTVPDVVGMYRGDAERALRDESFLVRVTYAPGAEVEVGKVDAQAPPPGTIQHRRTWVEIVVIQPFISGSVTPEGGPPPALPGMREGPGPDMSTAASTPKAPAVGDGRVVKPPPTPRGPEPLPPVDFPAPGEAKSQVVPDLVGEGTTDAITKALAAGLAPVVQIDRASSSGATVLTQNPEPGTALQRGALVRMTTGIGGSSEERSYDLKLVLGAGIDRARGMYERAGIRVNVIEVSSPTHPYAGTKRVVAQWPVSTVPISQARVVNLWVVTQ